MALVDAPGETRLLGLLGLLLGVLGHGSLSAGPCRRYRGLSWLVARAPVEFWTEFVESGLGFVGSMCE